MGIHFTVHTVHRLTVHNADQQMSKNDKKARNDKEYENENILPTLSTRNTISDLHIILELNNG